MQKIPTLFKRDPNDMRRLLEEVHPDCQWVLDGEGVPTRQYDGTCVALDLDGLWQARHEVKAGKPDPDGFQLVERDETTGKRVGWEPVANSGFYRWFAEAFEGDPRYEGIGGGFRPGTYELIGPKINGNPEKLPEHRLVRHADASVLPDVTPRSFETLKPYVLQLGDAGMEGVVWHHPDGRMAKLKARDFPAT